MAKKTTVGLKFNVDGTPALSKATGEINKQKKAIDRLDKSEKKRNQQREGQYTRQKQGVVQTANQTKNFSKLQQSVDGGGAGGLVRAYALLAANVFALSAAFGVLSRSAQVDTLTESMRQLEIVSGNSVRSVARDLQEASGFGLDFADAMRSTSLALSAGFDTTTVTELGKAARNAAVSLGRPMGDALDRIFRGVIKVEPELLDEIGLFVRVKEAAARYASGLGLAASELTDFQKRQAFAAESLRQANEKFEDFSGIDTDAYSQLAAAFSDVAQNFTSMLNTPLAAFLKILAGSQQLMIALFGGISVALLSKAVPALGLFARTQSQVAADNASNHQKYIEALDTESQQNRRNAIEERELAQQAIRDNVKKIESTHPKAKKLGGAKRKQADIDFKLAKKQGDIEGQINAQLRKRGALQTTLNKQDLKPETIKNAQKERDIANDIIKQLEIERDLEREILDLKRQQKEAGVQPGTEADIEKKKLAGKDFRSSQVLGVVGTAETKGFGAALTKLRSNIKTYNKDIVEAGGKTTMFGKGLFRIRGYAALAGAALSKLMRVMQSWMIGLAMLAPILAVIGKRFGMWDDNSKALDKTMEKTKESTEILNEKLTHQAKVLNDVQASALNQAAASLAMNRTIRDVTANIIAQNSAMLTWELQASRLAKRWDSLPGWMGGGKKAEADELKDNAITTMLQNFDDLPSTAQETFKDIGGWTFGGEDLVANYKKIKVLNQDIYDKDAEIADVERRQLAHGIGRQDLKAQELNTERTIATMARKKLRDRKDALETANDENLIATNYTKALRNNSLWWEKLNKSQAQAAAGAQAILSIQESARDVARDYKDQFITKTDVDKVLGIFTQATANIKMPEDYKDEADMKVAERDRRLFIESIEKGESAINDIMSVRALIKFKNAKTDQDKLDVLEEERVRYFKQQSALKTNAMIIKRIATVQKQMAGINKKSTALIKFNLSLDVEKLRIAREQSRWKLNETMSLAGILDTTYNRLVAEIKMVKNEKERARIIKEYEIDGNQYLEIQNAITKENEDNLKLEMARATMQQQFNMQAAKILKDRVAAEEKLLKVQQEGFKLQTRLTKFAKTGTSKLNTIEEVKLMVKFEAQRLQIAQEKAKAEIIIIKAQTALLAAQLLVLSKSQEFAEYQATLASKDRLDINSIVEDLEFAGQVLEDAVTQGLLNSTDKFAIELREKLEDVWKTTNKTAIKTFEENPVRIVSQAYEGAGLLDVGDMIAEKQELENQLNETIGGATQRGDGAWFEDGRFIGNERVAQIESMQNKINEFDTSVAAGQFNALRKSIDMMVESLMQLGPQGVLIATVTEFSIGMVEAMAILKEEMNEGGDAIKAGLMATAQVISGISAILAAASAAKIAGIDDEIAAEKRRDGKSKASIEKIQALELKKESKKKKAFEQNKKLQMAMIVVTTAAAYMDAVAASLNAAKYAGMGAPAVFTSLLGMMGGIVLGLGAAQLAIVAGTSYQGGGSITGSPPAPGSISMGERGNQVDVSQKASAGELAYVRGERGIGTSATAFTPTGGAAGLRKGYANGGEILVGEQGPEIIKPLSPMEVVPNDRIGSPKPVEAHITINAIDAAGVEDVLVEQQGNIISMIRSAANDHGEEFLEAINVDMYGSPKSAGGIDY